VHIFRSRRLCGNVLHPPFEGECKSLLLPRRMNILAQMNDSSDKQSFIFLASQSRIEYLRFTWGIVPMYYG
jgi:hypothetical protein